MAHGFNIGDKVSAGSDAVWAVVRHDSAGRVWIAPCFGGQNSKPERRFASRLTLVSAA